MSRPQAPPFLIPRQPKTVLGWSMQKLREVNGWSVKETAKAFGCSPSHISRVEHGSTPSRELVQFYEDTFEAEGLLMSQFEVAIHAPEQERRRAGGRRLQLRRALPGDASAFIDDTIPHGTLMKPGALFLKTWRIRNSGTVAWNKRQLERQGPVTGPGLITSPRYVPIPDTEPGEVAVIVAPLKAPTYDGASIAYFKMVDSEGGLCFPDNYQLGLDALVLVRGQLPDVPSAPEVEPVLSDLTCSPHTPPAGSGKTTAASVQVRRDVTLGDVRHRCQSCRELRRQRSRSTA
jgi:transcriptional regulator with XRE-family HTH domain